MDVLVHLTLEWKKTKRANTTTQDKFAPKDHTMVYRIEEDGVSRTREAIRNISR